MPARRCRGLLEGQGEGPVVHSRDALDDRKPGADACVVGMDSFGAAKNGSASVETILGASLSPVFSTVGSTTPGRSLV